jgi:uncharacterized SAM-binding protein YcdF (DUF218 family)
MLLLEVAATAIYPLNVFFGLTLLAGVLRLLGWSVAAFRGLVLALVGLWLASTPVVAEWAYYQLERQYSPLPILQTPDADVGILLGGVTDPPLAPRQKPDLEGGADRIAHAADLYRAGKVRLIIASGGAMPWTPEQHTEAKIMAGFLEAWGVPAHAIVIESSSRTTQENAARVADIWAQQGFKSGLLITSAAHMPRALATFRALDLAVSPASSDVEVILPISRSVLDWIPSSEALDLSRRAVHEYLGRAMYAWRGWL